MIAGDQIGIDGNGHGGGGDRGGGVGLGDNLPLNGFEVGHAILDRSEAVCDALNRLPGRALAIKQFVNLTS